MGMGAKLVFGGFGLAIVVAGLAAYWTTLSTIPMGIMLLFAGLFLLVQVGWNKLFNSQFDDKDVLSILGAVFGGILLLGGLFTVISSSVPAWLASSVPIAAVIVGIFVIIQGLRS